MAVQRAVLQREHRSTHLRRPLAEAHAAASEPLRALQRSAGNQAVRRLVAGDLTEGLLAKARTIGSISTDLLSAMAATVKAGRTSELAGKLKGMGVEHQLVALAAVATRESEVELTDVIFKLRHPDRAKKPLRPGNPDDAALIREWIAIRRRIVRPVLGKLGETSRPAPKAESASMDANSGGEGGVAGNLETDSLELASGLKVGGATLVGGQLDVARDWAGLASVTIKGDLVVQGSLKVHGPLTADGRVKAARVTVKTSGGPSSAAASARGYEVGGRLRVAASAAVGGSCRLDGPAIVHGSVTVGGDGQTIGRLNVAGNVKVGGHLIWYREARG